MKREGKNVSNYLKNIYTIKDFYLKNIRYSQNSVTREKIALLQSGTLFE